MPRPALMPARRFALPRPALGWARPFAEPAALLQVVAIVVFAIWAASEGGFPATSWYPGTLLLLGLLVVGLAAVPVRLRAIPVPLRVAAACLAAFTAWSYLSILWADAQGDAWEGANRTLLYLVVFLLFATWPQRPEPAAALLGLWTLAITGIALVTLLRVGALSEPLRFFISRRLVEPAGYVNAAAATNFMAFWPALLLASRREVPWWLRSLFAGGAVILADVALMSQSRGSLVALPIVAVVYFALVPGRARSLLTLAPIAVALGATVPRILDISDRIGRGEAPVRVLDDALPPVLLNAALVAVLIAVAAVLEGLRPPSPELAARGRRLVGAAGLALAGAAIVVALAITGNPVSTADDAWASFKRGYSPKVYDPTVNRLTTGLGSNRYDFYRVALDRFADRPLLGVGADNFAEDYLADRRSPETPRYPHSLELRTLLQTGIVGTLLLLGAFVGAMWAAALAVRRSPRLAGAVAGGAALVFIYWFVHGSADWFWEFAGLGAPAFAMLGLAGALAPRRPAAPGPARPVLSHPAAIAGVGAVALVAATSLLAPWWAEREVRSAAAHWPDDPAGAFRRLDRARRLNPLSDRPDLVAGSIALRVGDLGRAERDFRAALGRDGRGAYATLELGALLSTAGRKGEAIAVLARARRLNPRDELTASAFRSAATGKRVDVTALNDRILKQTRALTH